MLITLIIVFCLNVISNTLGTLKTIFIAKKIMKPAYLVIFVDSIVFAYGFKMIATENSFWLIIAFSAGKVVGAYIADVIDSKMAFGLLEVTIYAKKEKALEMADALRNIGFSVTTVKGYGMHGHDRFEVNIALKRKEFELIHEFLKKYGYTNTTMLVREISSFTGKFIPEPKIV